jgi:hypothetical protein
MFNINTGVVAGDMRANSNRPSLSSINTGEILLKLSHERGLLNVFVGHVKMLPLLTNSMPPDAYVKCYLQPDHNRQTKRKTRIVRKTQNPTYNESVRVSYSI